MKINKREWLLLVLLVCLISGCGGGNGGGGNPYGNVTGTVVDNAGNSVGGIHVTLGSALTTTDSNGNYNFTAIPTGNYVIVVSGGSSGSEANHLAGGAAVTVLSGNNTVAPLKVYNMIGYGVVMRNASAYKSLTKTELLYCLEANWDTGAIYQSGFSPPNRSAAAGGKTASGAFLTGNHSLCYLHWKAVVDASRYIIYYLATGRSAVKVWDSNHLTGATDPYYPADPKAFLDLADELNGQIAAAEIYLFRIDCRDAGDKTLQLLDIPVSLGMRLSDFPATQSPVPPAVSTLSWQVVPGAANYLVGIFSDPDMTVQVYSSPSPQTANSFDMSASVTPAIPKNTYSWYVKANALDDNGWPEEVTVDTGEFDY